MTTSALIPCRVAGHVLLATAHRWHSSGLGVVIADSVRLDPTASAAIAAALAAESRTRAIPEILPDLLSSIVLRRAADALTTAQRAAVEAQCAAIRAWVLRRLRGLGFRRERRRRSASVYYSLSLPDGRSVRARVSDHDVPLTDAREHDVAHGGWSWALCGHSLVITEYTSWLDAARWLVEVRRDSRGGAREPAKMGLVCVGRPLPAGGRPGRRRSSGRRQPGRKSMLKCSIAHTNRGRTPRPKERY